MLFFIFFINEQGKLIDIFTIPTMRVSYYQLLRTNSIGTLTAIYNAERIGKFEMENIKGEDYALWLKILKKINYAYGIKTPLAKYRVRNKSVSSNKLKSAFWQWNIYRNIEELNLIESLYFFLNYIYWGLRKHRRSAMYRLISLLK